MGQQPLAQLLTSVALWCWLITSCKGEANPQPNADPARGSGPLPWQDPFQSNPRITEHPQDDYFAKNEPATLNCKAEGLPPPIITWYRNGELVETNRENPMSHRMLLDNGQLFFLRVIHAKSNKPDVGVYYCNATNVHGTAISRNATIKIASLRDEFRQEPTDTTVAVGKPVTLHCLPPRGEPEPKVFWRKDGDIVQPDSRIELQEAGTLVISSVRKSDTGEYQCFAINKGGERNSKTAQLRIVDVPSFQKMPKDITAEEGDTIEFECDVQGDRPLNIQWKKEGGVIRYGGARILPDNTLRIEKIEASDDGVYVCIAENAAGSTKVIARLTVLYAPSFLIRPRDQIVAQGRTVTLQCVATGNPPPTVFWSKGLKESLMFPNRENGRYSVAEDGTFRIERAQKPDEGTYVCEALNTRGQASAMARIEVRDGEFPIVAHDSRPPPIIRYGPDNQTLPTDTVAMLRCQAIGDPEPIIRWYKDGRPLMKDPRYALLDSGTLQISDLKISDSGRYTCKAISEAGETTWDCLLIVEVQSTSVAFHRAPDMATLPSAPSKPIITDVTDTSVHLSWQPGSSPGGSLVFAFQVEFFGYGTTDSWKVASNSIHTESYTVQELQLNTTYLFIVRAKNNQGLGPPSPPSELVRTLATRDQRTFQPSRVDLPRQEIEARLQGTVIEIVEGEAVNSSAIKIEWRLLKGQEIVDGFYVRYKHILDIRQKQYGEMKIERVPYSQTLHTITGLGSYNWYEICVMAYCQNVQSRCSNPLKVQTEESVFSEPPESIAIHKMGDTGLRLEWKAPKNGPTGDILSYKIHCFSEDGVHNCSKTVNGTVMWTTISDLEAGKRYRIKMAATTKTGMGQYSHTYMYKVGDQAYIIDKPPGSPDSTTIGALTQGSEHADLMKEPWFIGVLIGTIGGTLWLVLCIFSVWMCKKKKQKKKMKDQRYYTGVPKHKIDESSQSMLYGNYGTKDPNLHCMNDLGLSPELNAFLQGKKDVGIHDDNIYNTAGSSSFPELKTFYQKADPVAPYATTTLIESQNIMRQRTQGMDNMFRPINHGYIPCSEGSADSCQKPEVVSSDSNTDNSRPNTSGPQDGSDPMQSPTSDSGSHTTDENGLLLKHRKKTNNKLMGPNKQTTVNWAELLPPPPEHPPPSEGDYRGGNPPPTYSEVHGDDRANLNRSPISPVSFSKLSACSCPVPHSQTPVSSWNMPVYSDNECPRCQSEKYFDMRPYSPRQYIQRTQSPRTPTLNSGPSRTCGVYSHNHSPRGSNVNHSQPTRGTPTNYNSSSRGTTPSRGSQSDQESNIPCFQQYRIVPQREDFRFFSDSQWGPGPAPPAPPCQQCVDPSNMDPGRVPDGSSIDRACQSSLSSLVGDQSCFNNSLYNPNRSGQNINTNLDRYRSQDSPISEDADYATESDLEVTRCQEDPNDDHWATITDQCNTDCSSVRSSTCSSGDGSFLTEADFASAVARAAEMSGLTVVGTTVCDLNPKSKKERRQRRHARPISPGYSTDSNYGSIDIVHRPYPKSQRKKQLLEQGKRLTQKDPYVQREGFSRGSDPSYQENSHPTEVPYYSKPNFPAVLSSPMDISKLSPLGRKMDLLQDGSTYTDSSKQSVGIRHLEDNV